MKSQSLTLEYKANPYERAMALIRTFGTQLLGAHDGCSCVRFSVCGFDVDIHCRRSTAEGINLSINDPMNIERSKFEEMGRELQRQIRDWPGDVLPVRIRIYGQPDILLDAMNDDNY